MKNQRYGYFPDECWECVFVKLIEDDERDLDSISLVSKRFLSISNRVKHRLIINNKTLSLLPNLFQRFRWIKTTVLEVESSCKGIDGLLKQIAQSGVLNLKTIRLCWYAAPPRDGFRALALNKNVNNSLRVLDCSSVRSMKDNDLVLIGNCFPRLEELIIFAIGGRRNNEFAEHITDDGIDALASNLKELKEFTLRGDASFITDKSLISLSTNCVKLRAINLSLRSGSQNRVTEYGICFVMRHSPNLTSLSLGLQWAQPPAFSFTIENAFADAKILHSLSMTGTLIRGKLLFLVAKARPPLKKLELNMLLYCEDPEMHGALKLLLQACQLTLEELTLGILPIEDALTDSHISDLAHYLSNLTSIDINGSKMMTSSSFYTIIKSCPLLEVLKMGHMNDEEMDTSFPDCLGKNYRLRHLDVSQNTWVNDAVLENFGQFFPNLQFLNVSYCFQVTNLGTGQVLRGCPAITQLSIDGLQVSDVFGRYTEEFVVNLKTLIARQTQINDEGMALIGNKCRYLQSLDIELCNEVTDKGVMEVVRNCARLWNVNLFMCEKVSTHILPQMVFSSPSLRKVYHGSVSSGCQKWQLLLNLFFIALGCCST